MMLNRRNLLTVGALSALAPAAILAKVKPYGSTLGPRCRVLLVNDLAGDPDGLFGAVHALLSRSVEMRGIIATGTGDKNESAAAAFETAKDMLGQMGLVGKVPLHIGADKLLGDTKTPVNCAGARAIITETKRTDSKLPLFVTVGGGLTEVASALLIAPEIASKFTLVWIGGNRLSDGVKGEYNYGVDPLAAQAVFNDSSVPIWQVPSNVYSDCLVSRSELQAHVEKHGRIGPWLAKKLEATSHNLVKYGLNTGETWTLGDNPLVLLTALTDWVPTIEDKSITLNRTGSSRYENIFVPRILPDGRYELRSDGRKMRHYTQIDTRTMFGDFFAKMELNYGR